MDLPSWSLGLSLIVLTIAIHTTAVVLLAFGLEDWRACCGRAAYWWLGALDSLTDASVYSLATMTTFELPGLTVPSRFYMSSALETVNGALLFGISTAFLFAAIQVHWQLLSRRHGAAPPRSHPAAGHE